MIRTVFQVSAAVCLTVLIAILLPPNGGNVLRPLRDMARPLLISRYTMQEIRARLTNEEGGHIDRITHTDGSIVLEGWAADFKARRPAKSVQVFIGENNVGRGVPSFDRPDAASLGGRPLFGFRITVPGGATDFVKAYSELSDGSVAELHQPAPATPR